MSFKTFIILGFLLLFGTVSGNAQFIRKTFKEIELIGGVGSTNYFGDIGGKDYNITGIQFFFDNLDIDLWQTRALVMTGIRVAPWQYVTISFQAAPMLLSGNDQRSNYVERGYAFNTLLSEFSVQAEVYLNNRLKGFSPYLIAGSGGIFYAFKNNQNNTRSKIYPANTVIMGGGFRFLSKTKVNHTIDFVYHFASTDFLDGFKSTRKSTDLFFTVSYKLNLMLFSNWYYDNKGLVR